jgi:hypothetical protein
MADTGCDLIGPGPRIPSALEREDLDHRRSRPPGGAPAHSDLLRHWPACDMRCGENRNCLFEDFHSSPNSPRYRFFMAGSFKYCCSSIAEIAVGSMGLRSFLQLSTAAPWTLCLAGKSSRQRALSTVDFLAVPSVQVMPSPVPGNQRAIQASSHTTPKSRAGQALSALHRHYEQARPG